MKRLVAFASFSVFLVSAIHAAVRLGAPFTNRAVLQRDRPVPVWGKAAPGEKVTVSFASQTLEATADETGRWRVTLAPMEASSNPQTLRVEPGGIAVKDVLVGEVWLASGQSNMAFGLSKNKPRSKERCGSLLAQITTRPLIRYAKIEKKSAEQECDHTMVKWNAFQPGTLLGGGPSAVATYFALYLHDAIDIPVGIVQCAWGGTNIDAWIPHTAESAKGAKIPSRPAFRPGFIYRGSIAPIKPFSMRGVIWYQGEADTDESDRYDGRMKMLYDGWGRLFENEKWPFLFVQIAPYDYKARQYGVNRDMVGLQLAQARFAESEPNAYMTTVNDAGNIWDVHPNDKGPVGMRLAALALQHVYGCRNVKADPPVAVSARPVGDGKVEIAFRNGEGLYIYNENRSLEIGLEIAGADGLFHDASVLGVDKDGVIRPQQGRITVHSKHVSEPKRVRYLFKSPWYGALRNRSGIPAGPFDLKVTDRSGTHVK